MVVSMYTSKGFIEHLLCNKRMQQCNRGREMVWVNTYIHTHIRINYYIVVNNTFNNLQQLICTAINRSLNRSTDFCFYFSKQKY